MPTKRNKLPDKPTVFLSHSSSNRRELLALKRLLDERAGGSIEFFLSSDEESIAHGTIWPAEVRAALERMNLMLIFVSEDALRSAWAYFEAGFGLHKLGMARIYCLPGTHKGKLEPPFNILQNRNLHSAREISVLVQQINESLKLKLNDTVTKEDFDRIFRKPMLGQIETGPQFQDLVESVTVKAIGPSNSIERFSRVCQDMGLPEGTNSKDGFELSGSRYSTGIRISVEEPCPDDLISEIPITEADREKEMISIAIMSGEHWVREDDEFFWGNKYELHSISEVEEYNIEVPKKNREIEKANAAMLNGPRECTFELSTTNAAIPISIVDRWQEATGVRAPTRVTIALREGIACEQRLHEISARIHGTPLSLGEHGALLWTGGITVGLPQDASRNVRLSARENGLMKLSEFNLADLVRVLFDINVFAKAVNKLGKARR